MVQDVFEPEWYATLLLETEGESGEGGASGSRLVTTKYREVCSCQESGRGGGQWWGFGGWVGGWRGGEEFPWSGAGPLVAIQHFTLQLIPRIPVRSR